ncbi:MAG: hypothetical protein QNK11_00005, partial [Legionella sp.]|nr:hypothetical protein [Legionella sp.]
LTCLPVNFEEIIQGLSDKLADKLPERTKNYWQLHHGLAHALEVEKRTLQELKKQNIWQDNTTNHRFLRAMTGCLARLHDYVQKNKNNEAVTAGYISEQLITALKLNELDQSDQDLKKLIQWMSYQIILGGTTNLMGSMDLIDFQLKLEKIRPKQSASSNATLIAEMKQVAKIVGENDKTPGAVLGTVLSQARDKTLATFDLVKKHTRDTKSLQTFFNKKLVKYYSDETLSEHYNAWTDIFLFSGMSGFSDAVNQQAFFTSITPHVLMTAEFLKAGDKNKEKLYCFIEACREVYPESFDAAFEKYDIAHVMKEIFFNSNTIANEIRFIDSQTALLEHRKESVADSRATEADKANLIALKAFYDEQTPEQQAALLKSLMMGVVLQEGQLLAYRFQNTNVDDLASEALSGCRCF